MALARLPDRMSSNSSASGSRGKSEHSAESECAEIAPRGLESRLVLVERRNDVDGLSVTGALEEDPLEERREVDRVRSCKEDDVHRSPHAASTSSNRPNR